MRAVTFLAAVPACAAAAVVNNINARSNYALKDSHNVPRSWQRVADADPEHTIQLSIGLKQSQFDDLERHLYEVSDPDHARFGQHLSESDVNLLTKPHESTSSIVHDWLQEYGIDTGRLSYSAAKDWIHVSMPVSEIENLLKTKYSVFKHEVDGSRLVRTDSYSLPRHLHEHIDMIAPTNSFFRATPKARVSKRSSDTIPVMAEDASHIMRFTPGDDVQIASSAQTIQQACNFSAVTPKCLRTLYGTIDYKAESAAKNKIGIANYLGETQNRSDLALFLSRYRSDAAGAARTFQFKIFQGGENNQQQLNAAALMSGQDLEGNLDGDYVLGIGHPTPLTSFNTGGMPPFKPDLQTPTDTNEPYLAWVNHVLALPNAQIPQVISTSYGDDEQTVPLPFAKRICQQYAALGARGVTLLFSSGDVGVGPNGKCFTNDAQPKNQFLPSFSASCPFVTAVGGTKNFPEVVAFDPANGYAPGGGFSNYFARPAYQNAAVGSYLQGLGNKFAGLYNRTGRAYPDISAQGQNFVVGWNGTFVLLDGTSAASPTAAGVLTLVNDALIAAGKPVLGFLNPWLYKRGYEAFTDVTSGSARGCNRDGFAAGVGWDPASGFGTPSFKEILRARGVGV